jgi:hypothetical protein
LPISKSHGLLAIVIALGASSATTAARRPATPRGLIVTGAITEGDSPSPFSESVDLRTGFSKRTRQMGEAQSQSGFDGQPWEEANGIVTVSNLPLAVARTATDAWIDQQSWRERAPIGTRKSRTLVPRRGNPVTLAFDPATGLVRQATIAGDWGPIVVSYGDWRRVGRFTYPFHREEVSPVGERTIIQVDSARFVDSFPKGSLARPARRPHAEPLPGGSATIAFKGVGARSSHILVESRINDQPADLVFDTGAANYLTTDAAPRFGVRVTGGVNLSGVGESSSTGGYATIRRIALGDAALRDEVVVVGPSPFPPSNGKPSDAAGFTGFEFFAEYVTTIDYPAQQIRFATRLPRALAAQRVHFYNDGSHIYVRARVNGIEGLFGLDTGDGGTVTIFPAFASRFGVHGASGGIGDQGGGVGGAVKGQSGVLDRFSLGGLNFDRLPVSFSHNTTGAFASRSLAGNLGGGILQCYRITIDFPNHLLLLDPAPQSPRCAPGGVVSRA